MKSHVKTSENIWIHCVMDYFRSVFDLAKSHSKDTFTFIFSKNLDLISIKKVPASIGRPSPSPRRQLGLHDAQEPQE